MTVAVVAERKGMNEEKEKRELLLSHQERRGEECRWEE